MPQRIAKKTVIVSRKGERVKVLPGKKFDFTAAEIAEIEAANPGALSKVVIEVADEVTGEDTGNDAGETTAPEAPKKPSKTPPPPGAKKAAASTDEL
jgi:hypothetical protein